MARNESDPAPLRSIQSFADVRSGKRLPKERNLVDGRTQHPYIRLVDIANNRISSNAMKYLDDETHKAISRYIVSSGDICLAIVGHTIGLVFIVDNQWDGANLTENAARITSFDGVDSRYLFYYLTSPLGQLEIKRRTVGSAQGKLPLYQIREMEVPVPSLPEQERIANILGTLDDKIELNRRMNETLEAMARRLFRSWFVDFDPVHAKAALRREHPKLSNADLSRRALPNMAPEIAELFPDSFEDSTLGSIPKGWKAGTIGDLAVLDKSSVTPSAFPDEVFDHYSIPAFDDGMNPVRESGDQIKSNKFAVTPDCVLLTKLNPRIPRVWLPFPSRSRRSLCSTEFLVLRPNPGVRREFLFSQVSSRSFFEVYETMVTGTSGSHQRIRPEHLLKMEIVCPSAPVRTAFADIVGDQFTHSESVRGASRSLSATRDRLLPKLLSGELFISQGVT